MEGACAKQAMATAPARAHDIPRLNLMNNIVSEFPAPVGCAHGVESNLWMPDRARTVLIVDDDPQILHLVERMLRPRAINVLVAPRPGEALLICQRQPVHLLISDIAMPEMDGHKLAERVLKLQPDIAVLLISGHFKDDPPSLKPQMKFLKKPFFPSQLLQYLRELLPET